jgi:hypothetical protein
MATEKLKITSMITGKPISFDAYLTDMSQTFDSTWNTTEVFGRNDPIATFAGTKRSISLAFDVPAADLKEAKSNLAKCGKFATFLYPGYNTTKISAEPKPIETGKYISRPPLIKIRFANLIKAYKGEGLLGFVDSLSFTPVMEAGMFEDGTKLYPRTISLSFGFTVLHQEEVGHKINAKGKIEWMPGSKKIPFT